LCKMSCVKSLGQTGESINNNFFFLKNLDGGRSVAARSKGEIDTYAFHKIPRTSFCVLIRARVSLSLSMSLKNSFSTSIDSLVN